ncbi:MAG: hypothetical protein HFI14_01585 [Lachnospiraceae bacterium]|nr:hypothetical protein [Lachnospiraceae bacterium]
MKENASRVRGIFQIDAELKTAMSGISPEGFSGTDVMENASRLRGIFRIDAELKTAMSGISPEGFSGTDVTENASRLQGIFRTLRNLNRRKIKWQN